MDSIIWKNIYKAVVERNICEVSSCVERINDHIVEKWQNELRENFERELRLCIQKTWRMKRDLVEEQQEIPYQIGMVAGYVRAFESLYRTEGEQKSIVEALAQSSEKTRRILDCLYQEREHGMQHSALAEAIGSTPSSLSNLMKRVLLSGAVESSRSGKNTYYILTPAGERYCVQAKKRQQDWNLNTEFKETIEKILSGVLNRFLEDKNNPDSTQRINVGDFVCAPENTVPGETYQVKSIAIFGKYKYVDVIRDSNNSTERYSEETNQNVYQNVMDISSCLNNMSFKGKEVKQSV